MLGGAGYDQNRKVGVLYMKASNQVPYLGFAGEWRAGITKETGVVIRDVEHGERVHRRKRPGAKAKRYSAWRRSAAGTEGNLILRREKRHIALALETVSIGGIDPRGNVKKPRRPHGRKEKRRRPPPWHSGSVRMATHHARRKAEKDQKKRRDGRKRGKPEEWEEEALAAAETEGPLDSREAKKRVKTLARKLRKNEKERERVKAGRKGKEGEQKKDKKKRKHHMCEEEKSRWDMDFATAYRDMMRRKHEYGDGAGPIDIEHPSKKRLLLTFLVHRNADPDWAAIARKWGCDHPEIRLAGLVEKLQRAGRARVAWSHLERRMRTLQVPLRHQLTVEISQGTPRVLVLREVKKMVMADPDMDVDVQRWILQSMRVKEIPGKNFFQLRNAGKVMRDMKVEDVEKEMAQSADLVVGGAGFLRVPGSSKVIVQQSTGERIREIRTSLMRVGRAIRPCQGVNQPQPQQPAPQTICLTQTRPQEPKPIQPKPAKHFRSQKTKEVDQPATPDLNDQPTKESHENSTRTDPSGNRPEAVSVPSATPMTARPWRPTDSDYLRIKEANPTPPHDRQQMYLQYADQYQNLEGLKGQRKGKETWKRWGQTRVDDKREWETKRGTKQTQGRERENGRGKEKLAACAEDKSPKETWMVPVRRYCAAALFTALVAGWIMYEDLSVASAEYTLRGWWADHLPLRLRHQIGPLMSFTGAVLPYYYATVKLKCYKGGTSTATDPETCTRTCTKEKHSCMRKVVSYFGTFRRKQNQVFHRCAQVVLMHAPGWESWTQRRT